MQRRSGRSAFTLLELMVVMAVILMLTSIVGVVVWSSQQGENVPRAANLVQGALVQAKTRAALEKQRYGVRFMPTPDGSGNCTELVFIRDPGTYAEGRIQSIDTGPADPTQPQLGMSFLEGEYSFTGITEPGDYIEFHGGGQVHQIVSVSDKTIAVDSVLPMKVEFSYDPSQPNYRIFRQPRPVEGMEPLKLPENAIIKSGLAAGAAAGEGSLADGAPFGFPNRGFDIVFSENGQVVGPGPAAAANVIYLWVGDTDINRPDNNYLVVVYTRTGNIATYPVNTNSSLGDKYHNARVGRAAGGL